MKINSLGAFVPLIGGASIGAQNATGLKTQWALSWPIFEGSDKLFTNSFDIPWFDNDQVNLEEFKSDLIVAVPPCAGLSSSSRTSSADNDKNCYMREVVARTTQFLKPKVLLMENAPTLCSETSSKGITLRNELTKIALENNYTAIYIKVTTANTGVIPQFRPRTFAIFYHPEFVPSFVEFPGQLFKYDTKYQINNLPSVDTYLYDINNSSLEIDKATSEWKKHQDLIDVTNEFFENELFEFYSKKQSEHYNNNLSHPIILFPYTIEKLIDSPYLNLYRSTALWTILTSNKYLNILNLDNCDEWLDYIVYRLGKESYAYKRFSNEVRFNLKGIGKRPFSYSTTICGKFVNTVFCQSLNYIRHPSKNRLFTISEVMALMGQQEIKMFSGVNNITATQSVPSETSKMVIKDFILNENPPMIDISLYSKDEYVSPLGGFKVNSKKDLIIKPGNKVVTPALSI